MDRYKITSDAVKKAVNFIKDGSGKAPLWATKYKDDLSVRGSKLFYKEREVVSKERVNDVLREQLYKKGGDIPSGRDAAFHLCKQRYVGISRRALMQFIRGQKPLGEIKAAQNKPKRSAGERLHEYTFETDLVFLKKNDLEQANKKFIRDEINDLTYFLTVTEKVTGLTKFAYVKTKEPKIVTPLVVKLAKEMCKSLQTTTKQTNMRMDKGGEFSVEELSKHFKKAYNVSSGVNVENKNAQFQKCFFQILRQRKATTIKDAMKQSEVLLNNTYNRIHKMTSNEVVERGDKKENILEFNRARKSFIAGDKRKPFKVGDYVRIQIKPKKEELGFKRYKNKTYGERVFVVKKTTKKAVPAKFRVNGKWYLQSDLVKSAPRDEKSLELVQERDEEFKQKRKKELVEHIDKREKEIIVEEKKKKADKRPSRKAGRAAKLGMLHAKAWMSQADDRLDDAEAEEEKAAVAKKPVAKKAAPKPVAKKVAPKPVAKKPAAKKPVAKKAAPKSAIHVAMINYLTRKNLPTGGTLKVLKKRIKQYKKTLKQKALKV